MTDKLDIHLVDEHGWTQLCDAAYDGNIENSRKLISMGADIDKPNNNGCTPLFFAAQEGHKHVVEFLCSQGADVNRVTNDGQTSLTKAIHKQHNDVEQVLLAHGASIPTDELVVETVDDVVQFFKRLNIRPEKIPQMEKKIKEDSIDAVELFAIPDGKTMLTLLGVSEMGGDWGVLFYRLVKNHEKIQLDREQTYGAKERAVEALKKMDNKSVRRTLYKLQRDFFLDYIKLVIPRFQTHGKDEDSQTLTTGLVEARIKNTISRIREEASDEESRLGKKVTEVCLEKYKRH